MRKTLLLMVAALSLLGSVAVHADPPMPVCPPFCDPGAPGAPGGPGSNNLR